MNDVLNAFVVNDVLNVITYSLLRTPYCIPACSPFVPSHQLTFRQYMALHRFNQISLCYAGVEG
jgi:hypothetical protein